MSENALIRNEEIQNRIHTIRGIQLTEEDTERMVSQNAMPQAGRGYR